MVLFAQIETCSRIDVPRFSGAVPVILVCRYGTVAAGRMLLLLLLLLLSLLSLLSFLPSNVVTGVPTLGQGIAHEYVCREQWNIYAARLFYLCEQHDSTAS